MQRAANLLLCTALAACAPRAHVPMLEVSRTDLPYGITQLEAVQATPGNPKHLNVDISKGGDLYTLEAEAQPHFTSEQVMALLWCRANHEAERLGYAGMEVRFYGYSTSVQWAHATGMLSFYHPPLPEGVLPLHEGKDWCLSMPKEALGALEPSLAAEPAPEPNPILQPATPFASSAPPVGTAPGQNLWAAALRRRQAQ